MQHLPERDRPPIKARLRRAWAETDYERALEQLRRLADELEHTHPGAAGSLREGMEETLTVIRLGIKGRLKRTLESTNPAESMIDTVRTTHRNVKNWSSGEMGLRWTAAGMLEAEKQFRKVIGYTRATRNSQSRSNDDSTFTSPTPPRPRRPRSQSLCNDHTRTVVTEVLRRPGQPLVPVSNNRSRYISSHVRRRRRKEFAQARLVDLADCVLRQACFDEDLARNLELR